MKKLTVLLIDIYQYLTKNSNAHCRFMPTCSEYAREAFIRFGVVKGGSLSLKRILTCHPFSHRPIYDPLP